MKTITLFKTSWRPSASSIAFKLQDMEEWSLVRRQLADAGRRAEYVTQGTWTHSRAVLGEQFQERCGRRVARCGA